jgi:signal transduction histidine kinase
MLPSDTSRRPGLVGRFAIGSLAVLVLIGLGVGYLTARNIRRSREEAATFHAMFTAQHLLARELTPQDVAVPIPVDSSRYRFLRDLVRTEIMSDHQVVRVKLWRPDGTVLYSDDPREVGRRFEDQVAELDEAIEDGVASEVSTLDADENASERALADKLMETYVPVSLSPGGSPVAVAEFYQDYAHIQAEVDRQFGQLTVIFVMGLALLYLLLLPIARGASRRLQRQKDELRRQAERLAVLLAREQHTVAELQELNRLKGDFIAVASHELRTPLTSILGYGKLLRRKEFEDDPASRSEFLDTMERQGDRLLQLVENLLTTSRLESGELPVSLSRFDLATLLRETVDALHAGEGRIRVTVPSGRVEVETDRDRVCRVVANLLDNAMKYSPAERPVEVWLRVDGPEVELTVRDRGEGISEDVLPRIFDRFYQADGSITRPAGGVGLGLYLVHGLVRSLAGGIEVASEPGVGTTFSVRFPAVHPEALPGDAEPVQVARGA